MSHMLKERRKYKRFDVSIPVRLRLDPAKDFATLEKTRDVSKEGMQIITQQEVKVGSRVDMELLLPNTKEEILARGEVKWHIDEGTEQNKKKRVGIEYTMFKPFDRNKMLDYAYDYWLVNKLKEVT